jgi:DNA-binding GntR family transcriptional regulator
VRSANGTGTTQVNGCVEQIREMILLGDLVPGEQLRQVDLAERLKVSRVPLREALAILHAEGALSYRPNAGYFVTRLDAPALLQMFIMRELLETEVLKSIQKIPASTYEDMKDLFQRIDDASEQNSVRDIVQLNRQFHFALFELSPHQLIVAEIRHLWDNSAPYSTFHAYDPAHRKRVRAEHLRFLTLVKRGDIEGLAELATLHRAAPIEHLQAVLRGERAARLF